MSALILVCLWIISAKVIAMFPSRDFHWRSAYILIAIGVPILAWTVYTHGILFGALALLAGSWVLRWPVFYAGKWVKRVVLRRG